MMIQVKVAMKKFPLFILIKLLKPFVNLLNNARTAQSPFQLAQTEVIPPERIPSCWMEPSGMTLANVCYQKAMRKSQMLC